MAQTTLYIFSGLPACGKSTLAKRLAKITGATYIRIDTVEQGLKDLCNFTAEAEGYLLSYRLVRDNLKLGTSVIADSCNTLKVTRNEWEQVAVRSMATFKNLEIRCSDEKEHKYRVDLRQNDAGNPMGSDWVHVQNRYYEPWDKDVISIDTSGRTVEQSFLEMKQKLAL